MSAGGLDGAGRTDQKGAKQVTAVRDCASTFLSEKPADTLAEGLWTFNISQA